MAKSSRAIVVWVCLASALAGLIYRLIDLSILERPFLLKQSNARIIRDIVIPGYRGIITDRLGSPLAVSAGVQSIWINPKSFQATTRQVYNMAQILHISPHSLYRKIRKKNREFVYIKRAVAPSLANRIKTMDLPGVFFQREYRRYYPEGEVTAHVVGFTDIDEKGREGIELGYDRFLAGRPGKREVVKDRLGNIIDEITVLKQPSQGKNLQLSLDHRIQYVAYQSLKKAVNKYHAKSGSAIVLDVKTGEVLAMVNQPSYNPNDRYHAKVSQFRNRAVTDLFEPGSVIKPFTIALALQSSKYAPNTKIDTDHGWMKIGGYRIRDDLDYGIVTLTELLQKSSNIAAAKILLSLDPANYWELLSKLGFGQRTDSGFPGEASGVVAPQTTWVPSVVATLAYGYGVSVTALQMAQAYAVIAAGGIKYPVTFLKVDEHEVKGQRVLPEKIARNVVEMLKTVVEKGGTGTRARVAKYQVAGKTGTAYIAGPHGYYHHRYMSSFIGLAPADNPRVVVAVVIKEPQGRHFGGLVAAPAFSEIMRGALRFLNVAPAS